MQESHLAGYGPAGGDGPSRFSHVRRAASTGIGACVAVALLLAMGMWFYRLGVRDAENVPIIRAAAEPAKIRPEDPGGAVAPHQDITSYSVAASRPVQATAAVIAPPPPEPRREDVAMGTLAPAERPQASAPTAAHFVQASAVPAHPAQEPPLRPTADGEQLATAEPVAGAPPVDPVPNASDYAPPLSPVARPRPDNLKARMVAAVQAAERSADGLARRAAESEIQVQLAADSNESVVRGMWQRIARANQDILHDRELAVQTTTSGGTRLYRLRVGPFKGVSEARAVCQALKARGQDCIVARNG
ncbi:MAG TPA: SPOR domain-containing protein [Paracoccaceae bacterium]|nr:SPOR domain-containing protein [Paracoccaceae bacterium]